ncbi:hypothetical protein AMC90_CH02805 [Rhizobium phaseoli]|uniref:hypothetical protein n=1 Tax=Rhizobium phaseoli TaxID=396 RepID=UPI0007EA4BA5|nr:hypothetical protein [Rhizobium phaseoli]ANL28606.1 hypothetical protein AMC90_CH02805 [Rhizobium phaseoli]ANM04935.1 hypothetical protein AMC78_CH02857 [Rhizobium phaseoli]
MTTKIPEDVVSTLHSKPHRAVHLVVTSKLDATEGAKVLNTVSEFLAETSDTAEMLPVWMRFTDLNDCEIYALQPFFVPSDKDFLSGLILAINGVEKHMTVSSFDYRARQYPKKGNGKKRAVTADPLIRRAKERADATGTVSAIPDPNCLPLSLRFFACDAALAEAKKLGEIYDRWPFFGFCRDDLKAWSEKLVAEFAERYPYLAEADKVLAGKLTEVITELGKHPYQKPFELRRFWISVRKGGVKSWKQLANELLCEIAKGAGNPFRHYEGSSDDGGRLS